MTSNLGFNNENAIPQTPVPDPTSKIVFSEILYFPSSFEKFLFNHPKNTKAESQTLPAKPLDVSCLIVNDESPISKVLRFSEYKAGDNVEFIYRIVMAQFLRIHSSQRQKRARSWAL